MTATVRTLTAPKRFLPQQDGQRNEPSRLLVWIQYQQKLNDSHTEPSFSPSQFVQECLEPFPTII